MKIGGPVIVAWPLNFGGFISLLTKKLCMGDGVELKAFLKERS